MTVCRLLMLFLAAHGVPLRLSAQAAARIDSITIVSVSPSEPVRRGLPVEFTLKVDVLLASADSAAVQLLTNSQDSHRFQQVTTTPIHRGRQRITILTRVVPVDWGSEGQFGLMLSIAPTPQQRGLWRPTVSVRQPIRVTP